ncbi:carbon starvation protein [Streptococcus parauberis]|uniref:carbon starvation protein n=1 Tax=Streptococcus parauberis TaxID=1348 RepID=UPI000CCF109E|nr:carbon starvation protein [Streptococcus parauberis]PNY18438.1 hypothetical protein ASN86_02009 [Streptococcus parauberis]
MNKELNSASKARLYGLTSIVCSIWLIQTIYQTIKLGEPIFSFLNIVFYISIIIVVVYTAISAKSERNKSKDQ